MSLSIAGDYSMTIDLLDTSLPELGLGGVDYTDELIDYLLESFNAVDLTIPELTVIQGIMKNGVAMVTKTITVTLVIAGTYDKTKLLTTIVFPTLTLGGLDLTEEIIKRIVERLGSSVMANTQLGALDDIFDMAD